MKNKKIKIAIASAIGLVLVIWMVPNKKAGHKPGSNDDVRISVTATRSPLRISVMGSGEIESKDSHRIVPKIAQNATVSWLIPDGTRIKKGDLIAKLNTDAMEREIEDDESKQEENLNLLDASKTDLEIQALDNQTNQKAAEQALEKAVLELEQFLKGDQPLQRRVAELKLIQYNSDLERYVRQHNDIKELLEEGFVTQDEVDEAKLNMTTAEINVETAKIEQDILEKYNLPLALTTASNAVVKAKTELEKTVKKNESLFRAKERAVLEAQRKVDRQKQNLEDERAELEGYTIYAPAEGVVQHGDSRYSWRRSEIMVGSSIQKGMGIMMIPELSSLIAKVNVNESDIRKIKEGQRAIITIDALSGKVFEGSVTKVAEVANSASYFSTDIKEFEIEIALPSQEGLKPGFSCKAEIVIDILENVVQVPVQAVFQNDKDFFVYLKKKKAARQTVRLGEASLTHIQIEEGLEEGQEVYLSEPASEDQPL